VPEDARREGPRLELVVAGHANIDRFLSVAEWPELDRTVPLLAERSALGGTAATLARCAARAGVRVGLVARVGSEFPTEFLALLRRDGVALDGVERVPDARSPTCYVIEDGRGHQVTLIHQGPMGDPRGAAIPDDLLGRTDWLHLTTGAPRYLLQLKLAARRAGVRVAVDPAQEVHYLWNAGDLRRLLEGAEILFGNRSEIDRILALLHRRRVEELLTTVPLVIRTEGARGATAFARTGTVHAPAGAVPKGASVTGAGDAFRGGFYGAFFRGEPLGGALREGHRAATAWMRSGLPRRGPAPR
jgi:nucleoside kinase